MKLALAIPTPQDAREHRQVEVDVSQPEQTTSTETPQVETTTIKNFLSYLFQREGNRDPWLAQLVKATAPVLAEEGFGGVVRQSFKIAPVSPWPEKVPLTLPRRQQAYPNLPSSASNHPTPSSPLTELHRSEAKIRESFNHLDIDSNSSSTNRTFGLVPHQYTHLRDSLIFNHERLLQHQDETVDLENLTSAAITNTNFQETPFSVSQSVSVTDRRFLNMANANELDGMRKHVGWVDNSQDAELMEALERASWQQNQVGNDQDTNQLQLTDGTANFNHHHLPSPPTSPLIPPSAPPEESRSLEPIYRNSAVNNPTNTTTVTTVYAYKSNRTGGGVKKMEIGEAEEDMPPPLHNMVRRVSLEDIQNQPGRERLSYEEQIQQTPYPFPPVTPTPYPQHGNLERVDTSQQMNTEILSGCQEIESKPNDTNLTPIMTNLGGQDDELDDDLSTFSVSKPVFPNPAELKWPDHMSLIESLPKMYHGWLATHFKKDPRVWLWKNKMGRRARQLLATSGDHASQVTMPPPLLETPIGARKPVIATSVTIPNELKDVRVGVHHVAKENQLEDTAPALEPADNEFQFI
ncbi:hypothetical protein Ocin01_13743 [Orchesella cincta]|uniref:Uncharacterized protein n=1 Tax=Orchesella cincta TaxID=48709 RepID=A0A1D2MIX0_ORCCI|nr:hypothetical protein Ocin01_13743 [Orchesella cincta]